MLSNMKNHHNLHNLVTKPDNYLDRTVIPRYLISMCRNPIHTPKFIIPTTPPQNNSTK